MLTCNCTLPYSNPGACKSCSRYLEYENSLKNVDNNNYPWTPWTVPQSPTNPWDWKPETKTVKRVTRTIEKYDAQGKLIGREVITEEVEDVEKYIWTTGGTYVTTGEITVNPGSSLSVGNVSFAASSTVTHKKDVPFTLTSNAPVSYSSN